MKIDLFSSFLQHFCIFFSFKVIFAPTPGKNRTAVPTAARPSRTARICAPTCKPTQRTRTSVAWTARKRSPSNPTWTNTKSPPANPGNRVGRTMIQQQPRWVSPDWWLKKVSKSRCNSVKVVTGMHGGTRRRLYADCVQWCDIKRGIDGWLFFFFVFVCVCLNFLLWSF